MHNGRMPNNNDVIDRPFNSELADGLEDNIQRKVDYRAIANYLSNEIYHLVIHSNDPQVKQWGRNIVMKLHEKGLSEF